MKNTALMFSVIVSLLFLFAIPAAAEEDTNSANSTPELAGDAKSAILIERDTGKILFDKNTDEKLPPASMTKVMTLLLIMEALETGTLEYDEVIQVSERAASMGGSQIFLEAGEEMSVKDLLKGVAVASGNDASVALAERIAGSEEAFVERMNERAKQLGLENTKFQNVTGLPADDHYSTAYDMAMMAKELLKYEEVTNYTSIYEDYLRKGQENEFWLVNTNKLIRSYPGVDGLKTGFTNAAKYCLTATAEKNDMRVIAVAMGADTPKERNKAVAGMLDYAFNNFSTKKLFEKDEKITELRLLKAKNRQIDIVASESISTVFQKGEDTDKIRTTAEMADDLSLPLKKGDQVGILKVHKEGEVVSETPLTVNQDVNKASYLTFLKRTLQELVKTD
ncbi:D-alanyl-D-alanine carboxypeptidase family protein [Lentibacillus sediminis]|uniref:D-alanyl-D-alanine carboxypeptidase family protein n=1 Tax=Lentibacillus sediminis TaxID=1940529 RepID=UPI000C1BDC5B|nr:D-alanyl-D-alanine carboxypeptidase family protein [Lentibacillus sediminis]